MWYDNGKLSIQGKIFMNSKEEESAMKIIGILLIIVGVIGILLGSMMFGDIGVAAFIGAVTAILSGIGFLKANKALKS